MFCALCDHLLKRPEKNRTTKASLRPPLASKIPGSLASLPSPFLHTRPADVILSLQTCVHKPSSPEQQACLGPVHLVFCGSPVHRLTYFFPKPASAPLNPLRASNPLRDLTWAKSPRLSSLGSLVPHSLIKSITEPPLPTCLWLLSPP